MQGTASRAGLIGLGRMGGGIARCILRAGFPLRVYDLDPGRMQALAAAGAAPTLSPSHLATQCEAVLLSLPSDQAVAEVCLGGDGLVGSLRGGALVVDLGTTSYGLTLEVAEAVTSRGAHFVDMPVSGGPARAESGTLTTMWGGQPDELGPLQPLVAAFSPACYHVGPTGSGQIAKQTNNMVNAINLVGAMEGLVLAAKAGLDPALFVDLALTSSGASAMLARRGPKILARQFDSVDHPLTGRRKDLEAALELGRRFAVPTPLAAIVHGWVLSAIRRGRGTQDSAALLTICEDLAGFRLSDVRPSGAPGLCPPSSRRIDLRVGFIGLGRMGKPMAECVRRAGFPVVVHNRSQAAVDDLVRQGAERAGTPAEVAARSDVALTCLPDDAAVERVFLGDRGLIDGASAGLVLVDLGTTTLELTRRLDAAVTAKGGVFADAPVSGGIAGAARGDLTVLIGATDEGFQRASPVLAALGQRLFHLGPPGSGQVAKAVNNMLLGTNTAAMCEGLTLGVAGGIPADLLIEVLLHSTAASYAMQGRGPMVVRRDFRPLFTTLGRLKDSHAVLELGRELHVPLPLAALAHELYQATAARGWSAEDFAAVVKVYETLAGVPEGELDKRGT